ncbi:MAG: hypothetical protein JWP12_2820 [Bacteroidetes bacterium]|nr:hypothetical protein [Bacteroidota bacterium]
MFAAPKSTSFMSSKRVQCLTTFNNLKHPLTVVCIIFASSKNAKQNFVSKTIKHD